MENSTDNILDSLNEEQRAAVQATDGPVMIIAGAGSGKTRVLTSRVSYLLAGGVDPSKILALTFTKKAATEMKERIALMVGRAKARKVVMGTFHSVFVRFLREYCELLGYPQNFTIYDSSDSQSAIKVCLKELHLSEDKNYKPKDVLSRISNAKNNLVTWDKYATNQELVQADVRSRRARFHEVYKLYQLKLKNSGVMDFDDILVNMNLLLRDNPAVCSELASRFSHIMVDEYQDTNFSQYVILRRMAFANRNICVVGDDSQSIYAFRGAKIENILSFKKDYPDCKVFRLERNYRSTQTIVNAANSVIAHNEGRIDKKCYSMGEEGEKIEVIDSVTDGEESAQVVQHIVDKMRSEHARYCDFAILYRTNSQSRSLEECLRRRNIPYMIYSGNSFFDRAEVKDMMAYFKLAVNPQDDESFRRVVNKPARGIGETSLTALAQAANAWKTSLFKAGLSPELELYSGLKPAAIKRIRDFCMMVERFAVAVPDEDALVLAKRIADESGLYPFYQQDKSVEGLSRTANIEELVNSVASYIDELKQEAEENGDVAPLVTLGDYLENVSLLSNVDVSDDEEDSNNKVALMTVHSAKGLEFPYVFVVGLEENLFPAGGDFAGPKDIEEERRLFYVALTRAGKSVVLSHCYDRMRNGKHEQNPISRFVREIDSQYLEKPLADEEDFGFGGFGSAGGFGRFGLDGGFRRFGSDGGSSSGGRSLGRERFVRSSSGDSGFGRTGGSNPYTPRPAGSTYGKSSSVTYFRSGRGSDGASGSGSASRLGTSGSSAGSSRFAPAAGFSGASYGRPSAASGSASPAALRKPASTPTGERYKDFVPVHMSELYEGERIEHNRFGPGKIVSISGVMPELKAEVEFDEYGHKTLLLKYAKMRPEQKA